MGEDEMDTPRRKVEHSPHLPRRTSGRAASFRFKFFPLFVIAILIFATMGGQGAVANLLTWTAYMAFISVLLTGHRSTQRVWAPPRHQALYGPYTEFHVISETVIGGPGAADRVVRFSVAIHDIGIRYDTIELPFNGVTWTGCKQGDGRRKILLLSSDRTGVVRSHPSYPQPDPDLSSSD